MKRALLLTLLSTSAFAEGGWLTSRGRLQPETRLEVFGATNSFGIGALLPDDPNTALLVEALYAFRARAVELRGGRVWQLTANRFATASATLSGVAHVVPEGTDFGLGPHGILSLALGGSVFTVDLSAETGAELFFNPYLARIPIRGTLGLNLRLGHWALSAQARLGADVLINANFVGRGELMLSLAWLVPK